MLDCTIVLNFSSETRVNEDDIMPLREDVRHLGELLGRTISEQVNPGLLETIEEIRSLSKKAVSGDKEAKEKLIDFLANLDDETILPVARAFNQFLNLSNLAEQYHRIRRTRVFRENEHPQPGSLASIPLLLQEEGLSKDSIVEAIRHLNIELVLTAHPTEVTRRTLMYKYERINDILERLDRVSLTDSEKRHLDESLQAEITAIWQTDEIRHAKPTAIDEARWGFAVVENSLWDAIPVYLRELDELLQEHFDYRLPLSACPIHFGSWMGGDRDGNPNVTAEVTAHTVYMARWSAAELYWQSIKLLRDTLSMTECNETLREIVGDADEPYRHLLKQVLDRLVVTRDWAAAKINELPLPKEDIYLDREELIEPLTLCYNSLVETGGQTIAEAQLTDVIRRIYCFGLNLITLDIRQEAIKHSELLSAITQYLGLGDYLLWSEVQKQQFILNELNNKRPLIPHDFVSPESVKEVMLTFQTLAQLPRDSLGAYIISMTTSPSDILAVALLQKTFSIKKPLPVVPLFETLADLDAAPATMDELLTIPWYRDYIQGKQEVMIGYSDSAKDVGVFSASWAQYCAQEKLCEVANQYQVNLTFFHGRGGSIGRGGAPTHLAITSQPPGSVYGALRVTQQGEVIRNRFGNADLAERTLSVYTTATLKATLKPQLVPQPPWRALMNDLSRVAAMQYKQIVEDPNLFLYFNQATPSKELAKMAIGSRPQHRRKIANIASLRAIPWVFAWTQNRLLLPAWLGIEHAFEYAVNTGRDKDIKEMFKQWPFFQTIITMFEMVLAKTEPEITAFYEEQLLDDEVKLFGQSLRIAREKAQVALLDLIEQPALLKNNTELARSIQVRNPYILPLNIIQVELLSRTRKKSGKMNKNIEQALLVSIAGIAAGMKNTG